MNIFESKLAPGEEKLKLATAWAIAEILIEDMGFVVVSPDEIDTNTDYTPGCGYIVGSIRRMKDAVGDIDILVTSPVSRRDIEQIPGVSGVYGGAKQINFKFDAGEKIVGVNVWVCTNPDVFGAFLLHTSGPWMYNVRLRKVAQSKNMKLSQNGLRDSSGRLLAGATEAEVQNTLGVKTREIDER